MANLTERKPKASALEATAVFTDKIDTNTAESDEITVVIKLFIDAVIPLKCKSFLIAEQIPRARKQFVTGTKIRLDIKFSP